MDMNNLVLNYFSRCNYNTNKIYLDYNYEKK